jgi:hypothetical protein
LKGGAGPDYKFYSLDEQDLGGTIRGITVGVVVDMNEPGTAVLAIPADAKKHIDTIKIRSKIEIPAGGQSKVTQLRFSDKLGGDRPVEVLIVKAGQGIVPTFTDVLDLTLLPMQAGDKPSFIRGDANDDAKLDIADGIWIINHLFYGGQATACKAAADANGDKKEDLTDAMYIFQYQLQPGATSSTLFPAPPAPFPNCGQLDSVTFDDCPKGSTTCLR